MPAAPSTALSTSGRSRLPFLTTILSVRPTVQKEYASLSDLADLMKPRSTTRPAFLAEARSGALDGVLVIIRTFASVAITGRIDDEVVDALPDSVKYICHNGTPFPLRESKSRILERARDGLP